MDKRTMKTFLLKSTHIQQFSFRYQDLVYNNRLVKNECKQYHQTDNSEV